MFICADKMLTLVHLTLAGNGALERTIPVDTLFFFNFLQR